MTISNKLEKKIVYFTKERFLKLNFEKQSLLYKMSEFSEQTFDK